MAMHVRIDLQVIECDKSRLCVKLPINRTLVHGCGLHPTLAYSCKILSMRYSKLTYGYFVFNLMMTYKVYEKFLVEYLFYDSYYPLEF